jgi:HEAT repeat protein
LFRQGIKKKEHIGVRTLFLVTVCLLVCLLFFQSVAPVGASDARAPGIQRSDLPRALLPKSEGNVIIRKEGGESISLSSNRSTLEEVLQRIAEETKVTLKFYCNDPSLKQERSVSLRISADSLVKALRQLLSEDYRFALLNREGKPTTDRKDVAAVNIYSKDCTLIDDPVRIFIGERGHPLLRKPLDEISLEDLGAVLKREGPTSRRQAADALGAKADEMGIAYAKEALKDENPGVMLAAVGALRKLGQKYGPEKVAGAVYERFREKPYAEFLPVMVELDKERIWPIIEGLTDQYGEREQGVIVRALVSTNDRRAIKYLSRIATTGTVDNSRQAIYGIGRIGGEEAATILMRLLREGDAQRQARAAQAVYFLPKGEGSAARAEVERIVKGEKVSDVMLQALVEASDLEPLEKLMKDSASKPEPKMRVLKALGNQGMENNIELMGAGLDDKTPQVRIASVEAMGAVAVEAAIPHLIRATEDKDAKVRSAAVRALSGFPGDDSVVKALGKALHDTDENVRRGAVDAIGLLGQPSEVAAAILRENKDHKDPYVANKAGSILRYWGLEKAVEGTREGAARSVGSPDGKPVNAVAAEPAPPASKPSVQAAGQGVVPPVACTYAISPASHSVTAADERGSISVTAADNCGWMARSSTAWIIIDSDTNGTGNGTIRYSVGANQATAPRTGTLTVAGQVFQLTQAAGVVPQHTLTILRAGSGRGKVLGTPAGNVFKKGTLVTLRAIPDDNSVFAGWKGACPETSAGCNLHMTTDRTVTASFSPKTYTIQVPPPANGVIHPSGIVKVARGEKRRFQVIPLPGYRVSNVLVDKASVGAVNSYTFEKVRDNHVLEAIFVKQ